MGSLTSIEKSYPEAIGSRMSCNRADIANNTYNQFEKGVQRPAIESVVALCDAYSLTLNWIYVGDMRGLRHETAMAILALMAADEARAEKTAID